jgi:hypothetical protein
MNAAIWITTQEAALMVIPHVAAMARRKKTDEYPINVDRVATA